MALLVGKTLLIVNPASRRATWVLDEALAAFRAAGVTVDFFLTEQSGHAGEIASQLSSRYDATFTLGGDGTADEVIGVLAGSEIPVGILPGGTGNLIARTLGTPLAIRRAIPALLHGGTHTCDLGLINSQRHFAFSLGIGADARMMAETSRELKRTFGVWAYAATAARASFFRETFDVVIDADGEIIERHATMVVVANFGSVLGNLIQFGPAIISDDGYLDVCVLSPQTLQDAVRVVWKMTLKDFSSDPCMTFRKARRVRMEASPGRAVQADGEILGQTPVEVEVQPMSARLMCRGSLAVQHAIPHTPYSMPATPQHGA
jgi:YegS/Rv2252/BmrU family lipid kinase